MKKKNKIASPLEQQLISFLLSQLESMKWLIVHIEILDQN